MSGFFKNLFSKKKKLSLDNLNLPEDIHSFQPGSEGGTWSHPEGESPITPGASEFNTSPFERTEQRRFDVPEVTAYPKESFSSPMYPDSSRGLELSPKDIQLILSKLDLINSRLENLNRKLEAVDATRKVERHLW